MTDDKLIINEEMIPSSPVQTVEEALSVSPERHTQITWMIEDVCEKHELKTDQIKAIAALKATDEEKVLMGFYLCKKYASRAPLPVRAILMRYIQ